MIIKKQHQNLTPFNEIFNFNGKHLMNVVI